MRLLWKLFVHGRDAKAMSHLAADTYFFWPAVGNIDRTLIGALVAIHLKVLHTSAEHLHINPTIFEHYVACQALQRQTLHIHIREVSEE